MRADRAPLLAWPQNDCHVLARLLGSQLMAIYDFRYSVTKTSGRVAFWDDARGAGLAPTLVAGGTNLPTWSSTLGISTDGVVTTGNFLRSPLNSFFAPNPGMTMIHIGGMAGSNFGIILSNNAQTQYLADCCQGANIQNVFSRDTAGTTQTVVSSVAGSATKRLSISAVSTNPNISPTQTSPYFFNEVGGRLRKLDTTGSWPSLVGTQYRINIGINQPGTAWSAFDTRALIMVRGDLTREMIIALKQWADAYHAPTYDVRRGIQFLGDSLTFGTNASSAATTYPGVVLAQTTPTNMTTLYDGVNLGIGGRTAFQVKNLLGYNVLPNIRTFRTKDIVCVWIGTNDVAQTGLTAAQTEAPIITIANTLKAAGAIVVGIPPIPREDAGVTSGQLANLKTLSDWFQAGASGAGFDAIVPLWNNALFNTWTFGASSAQNATNYAADKVHLTDVGYASIANDATNGVYITMSNAGLL